MKRILFILLLSVAFTSPAVSQEGWIGPTRGVLLLQNGNTISGAITVSGDSYVVAINEDAVIRVPTKSVQHRCSSLAEAHRYRCGQVSLDTIAGRLEIAQWCIRAELFSEADEHLQWVERSEPDNQLAQLSRRRLDSLTKRPEIAMASAVETVPAENLPDVISDKQLEDFAKQFHPQAAGQFATIVQPVLLNACSASACHGPASPSDYKLIQSGGQGVMPRRLTLRNMMATYEVAQVKNGSIPLLEVLYDTHGGRINTKTNAWPRQLAALRAWAQSVQPRGNMRPLQNDFKQVGYQDVLTPIPSAAPPQNTLPVPMQLPVRLQQAPAQTPVAAPAQSAPQSSGGYQPRDPFDPEVFNRRQAGQMGR
ncbi:hypothetical protein LOC68_07425 [Blastopirellula sp. JC732]|uniref:SLA1 homology domain-containing protein n=1 Tax=Blastopirellula sediminis TaxID=2894196 RepID=A0A9X1MK36_9BACT|nr:hypothetical protein [Blastopirellula sediminis]MCC9609002.1 hypothetical protein [Blastopirellula sediminis]MCC9628221.1 hypothetical protein [Blastopirellula sediminis]